MARYAFLLAASHDAFGNIHMTRIFLPSLFGDTDSLMIQVALEARGHSVCRWVGDNFPQKQTGSFRVTNEPNDSVQIAYLAGYDASVIDVVWLRRPRWPVLPEAINPNDQSVADKENRHFVQSFFHAAWHSAYWVNSLLGKRRSGSKMLQLQEAKKHGLIIPDTLFSNDPDEIRRFLRFHYGKAIVKPLLGGEWREGDKRLLSYTSEIEEQDLPDDFQIQMCPCIFQEKIEKQYEIRLVLFGAEVVAVRLNSQGTSNGQLDWRIADPKQLRIQAAKVPTRVYESCRELMAALNIVHGSFDFAVNKSGDWVFFEVNEAGQFLWLEDFAPEIPMLEIATQFLSEPSDDFIAKKGGHRSTIRDIVRTEKYQEYLQNDRENLISLNATAYF
jgi:glutathione synthase/RimK-type ligase-like ATP-grasp enzyme